MNFYHSAIRSNADQFLNKTSKNYNNDNLLSENGPKDMQKMKIYLIEKIY